MEQLCRLCLKETTKCLSMFSFKNGHQIADLVKIICPIEIDKNEVGMPNKVCGECLELIVDAIHLRDMSLMNDQELRKNLIDTKKEPIEEVSFAETYVEALEEALYTEENEVEEDEGEDDDLIDEEDTFEIPVNVEYEIEVQSLQQQARRNASNICEICNVSFANASSVKRHFLRKHSKAQFFCDLCNYSFKTRHDTENHMRRIHLKFTEAKLNYADKLSIDVSDIYEKVEGPLGYTCSFCYYIDANQQSLNDHLLTHKEVVDSGKMYCIHCPQAIKTMEFMVEHTKSHNESIKTHRCLVCNKTFPFDDRFMNHLRNHKKNQHKVCFCPECGRKFSKPRLMEDHIRFIHNKESLFCCPECGQGFGSKSALNGHIKRHIEGKKFQCPFCPRTFSSHNLLNSHKVVHSSERPYACTLCDKKFKHQKVLGDHMKRHEGTRPVFQCSICERSLNSAYALSRHMLTHTGSKPHQCEYCQKAYAQKNDLNKHLRTHLGENTYFCDFQGCDQSFRILADMRIHQGVHYINS